MILRKLLMLVFIAGAVCFMSAGVGAAAVITVDDNGGADFTSIQEAINASSPGDEIYVQSGTYYENVNITKQLTLRGIDSGGGKPFVDAGRTGSAITLSAGWSTVEGFIAMNSGFDHLIERGGIVVNSNNNIIKENIVSNNLNGIYLKSSSNNRVINNEISGSEYGIYLKSSSSNNILNGNIISGNAQGIYLLYLCNNNILNDNIINNNNAMGVHLSDSSNNTLSGNNFLNNGVGIYLQGNAISSYYHHIDDTNIVNGKPVYYFFNQNNMELDGLDAGHLTLAYCSNVKIMNSNISNGDGIHLGYSNNNILSNNTVSNNPRNNIFIHFSDNNILSNNTINNGGKGISLWSGYNNTFRDNNISKNSWGLRLDSATNNLIINNFISNDYINIYISSTWTSSNNNLYNNNIYAAPCVDEGTNQWDNGYPSGGNYWSDYTGTDNFEGPDQDQPGSDGIGDTPYPIPGGSSVDNYPLMAPWDTAPTTGPVHNINKGTHYTTIQAAIDDASPGDEIHVDAGTYIENVDVNKQLTLIGKGMDEVTVVAADISDHVFEVTADYVNISGFMVTGTTGFYKAGFYLDNSFDSIISHNNASNNNCGIYFLYSSNTTLQNNIVLDNEFGIELWQSNNVILRNNRASNNNYGINLWNLDNNTLLSNTASDNRFGIGLSHSSNNTLQNNIISSNIYNFRIFGDSLADYTQQIDKTNMVDGKPIYYWMDQQDKQIPEDAGFIGVVNSTNILVKDLNLVNSGQGILFAYTKNSRIENVDVSNSWICIDMHSSDNNTLHSNTASNNQFNIILWYSNNNTLESNNASNNRFGFQLRDSNNNMLVSNDASNNWYGIYLNSSNDNTLYHNNLIDNTGNNAYDDSHNNAWDNGYPSGGNYWSDYTGVDLKNGPNQDQLGSDGIGDIPYPISGDGSIDRYPLMSPYSPLPSDYEGNLLRQIGDLRVYLIEDGKKRHFTCPEAFEWNGYSFDDVIEVSETVINSFEPGSDITITQAIIDKYYALGGAATFGPPAGTGEQSGYPDNAGVICTYVNFQNGAIEYFTNGDQAGNAYAILNPFFDKWASMGYAKSVLGYPISDMSDTQTSSLGTPFKYQNFINGTERGALEYNLATGEVFEIHGAIYAKWEEKGFASGIMGLVTGDEKEAGKSPYGTTGRYSEFENGHIHWVSDIGDDNAGKIYRGKAFATYGDLDWLYTKEGGTNGKLGFPVMDKYETTTYGHGDCVFEGGKIIWDDYRGLHEIIYHGYLPDLTITDISFSNDNPVEGEPIIIYATIQNVGYADAKGKINVTFSQQSYYEDFEADETGNKAYIDQYVIENGLNAEDKITAEITWNTAPVFSANPKGFINVEVDSSKEIEETDEYNNVGWGEVSITSRSNFKPEIDSYHFHNFQPTSTELEQMTLDYKNYLDVMANQYGAIAINLVSYGSEKAKEWLDLGKGSLAVCYGMSSTSKIYYDNPELKPSSAETFSMLKTDEEVKSNIIEYQSLQTPYLIIQTIRGFPKDVFGIGELNIEKEYNKIEKSIQSGQFPIINIKWYEYNKFLGSHAVLAFNTYNTESETIKNVLVYDPNNPGMARVIQFDLAGNKIIYESYDYGNKIHQTAEYESYYIPTLKFTDSVAQINDELQIMYEKIIEHLYKNKYTSLIFDCPINVTIIDQFGRSIDEYGTNDIPNAEINIIGDLKVFNIPTDLSYTVYINAYDSGEFTFTQINPLTDEYASVISFVEIPITENTKATFDVSSINSKYIMGIDYDGDGSTDEMREPDIIDKIGVNYYNITFLPPIITMDQFSLTDGSTLPIKFTARNSTTDEFIYDDTVNVTITNSTGHLITYFTYGTGTDSVRINSEEEQYIANFHTKDYAINIGETYSITVTFGEPDSLRGYDITYFTLIEGGKAKGKSN